MDLKHTPLVDVHRQLGAKIVPFAGFLMPVQYTGIVEEHRRVRESVGLFDVSHMGEVEVRGPGALDFLQRVTINDVAKLSAGRVQYSAMCYEDGGIVDDLLVYHLGDHYLLVINASNAEKDLAWLRDHARDDVRIDDRSDATALLAVQGPQSLRALQKVSGLDLGQLKYYHSLRTTVAGVPMLVSRTGYTGELGYELYFDADPRAAQTVWNALMEAGREFGIGPAGLGARDTLRLEMGYCLYGNDIDQTTNPLEAGLGWITRPAKGDFIGRDAILKVKERGTGRRLVGFTVEGRAFPRHGYTIRADGRSVGHVTSGTFSPTLERGIGMGYVEIPWAAEGGTVSIVIRDREIPAVVLKPPFIRKEAAQS